MIDECKQCKHSCWDYVEALGGHKRWYVDSCDLDRDPYDEEECEEFEGEERANEVHSDI